MTEGMDVEKTDADTAVYVLSRIAGRELTVSFGKAIIFCQKKKKDRLRSCADCMPM